ncbi:MAG: transglutaminase domain-containing protein, partial [Bacteroidota bacterium]|nr:transglutaminase domain-containing protein [Bacteroidota bacterium]
IVPFNELDYPDFTASVEAFERLKAKTPKIHPVPIRYYDIDVITSDYLINNIDNAFRACALNRVGNLSFDDFCEYILPYRASIEPLQSWREHYAQRYAWIDDSIRSNPSKSPVSYFSNEITTNFVNIWGKETRKEPLPRLGAMQLIFRKKGFCEDVADLSVFAMRSLGFPASVDFVPFWATSSGSHFLNSTLDDQKRRVAFEAYWGGTIWDGSVKPKKFVREPSKVIRSTYSKQPGVLAGLEKQENIPDGFLRTYNYQDVTSEYWETNDLTCGLFAANPIPRIAYLCVLNYQMWQPTWWGRVAKDSVTFTNMPKGVVYLPVYYINSRIVPAGYPVAQGYNHQQVLSPDTVHTRIVKIAKQDKYLKIRPNSIYTLSYWDNQWKVIGIKMSDENTHELTFDKVPSNALLILIPNYSERKERPFIITDEGERVWF